MSIDQHPYLFIYLLGCALVVLLSIVKVVLFWIIAWITKGNILSKNLKKILPPDEKTFGQNAILFIGALALESALSWINVIVVVWQIMTTVLKTLREVFTSTPKLAQTNETKRRANSSRRFLSSTVAARLPCWHFFKPFGPQKKL